MPTLLQINTTLNTGSTGRIVEQISLIAQKRGWNCYIAHGGRYVNKSQLKTIQISSKADNIIHAIKGEFLGRHGFGSTLSTKIFLKRIDEIKPDVVHLHNIHGYYINIKELLSYLAEKNIPVVWTLHDCWAFTGHCTHFENYGCYKWKILCDKCPLLMAQYKSRVIDRTRSNYSIKKDLYSRFHNLTIVPVSVWLGDLVKQSMLKNHTMKVINNGIDLNLFKPTISDIRSRLGITEDKKMLLGVVASGLGIEKGEKEFCEFSKDPRFRVVLVGMSNKDKKNLPSNIICINRTNNQSELAEYYSAADVFINPTYNDTFPTTNIEAIACGTPVVTYLTGGSPEIIDKNTGIVVKRGDVKAMRAAIDNVLANGKDYYSKACRERAKMNFNKDDRFMDYIKLYEELMKK